MGSWQVLVTFGPVGGWLRAHYCWEGCRPANQADQVVLLDLGRVRGWPVTSGTVKNICSVGHRTVGGRVSPQHRAIGAWVSVGTMWAEFTLCGQQCGNSVLPLNHSFIYSHQGLTT